MRKGRPLTTGRFDTRRELEERVEWFYRNTTNSQARIASNVGVSEGVVERIISNIDINYGAVLMSKFKLGDSVVSFLWGEGEVIDVQKSNYPIVVSFKESNWVDSYTEGGRSNVRHLRPDLYVKNSTFSLGSEKISTAVIVKKDDLVYVRDNENNEWSPRYATGNFDRSNKIICYPSGKDSKTFGGNPPKSWKFFKLEKE